MCCTRLSENTEHKKSPRIRHLGTIACIDSPKKIVKQQCIFHMSSQPRPTNNWDRFQSLGRPSKFQQVSRLAFVTEVTSLTGCQPNFARCLLVQTRLVHYTQWTRKKRGSLFLSITLANLNRFLQFLYRFHREEILRANVVKFTTSPDLCAHRTWKN